MKITQSLFIAPFILKVVSALSLRKNSEHHVSSLSSRSTRASHPTLKESKQLTGKKPSFGMIKHNNPKQKVVQEHSALESFLDTKKQQSALDSIIDKDSAGLLDNGSLIEQFIARTGGSDMLSKSEDFNYPFGADGPSALEDKEPKLSYDGFRTSPIPLNEKAKKPAEEESAPMDNSIAGKSKRSKKEDRRNARPKRRLENGPPSTVNHLESAKKAKASTPISKNPPVRPIKPTRHSTAKPKSFSRKYVSSEEYPSISTLIKEIDHLKEIALKLNHKEAQITSASMASEKETESIPSKNTYSLLHERSRIL